MPQNFDVIVLGLGAMGSAAAYHLAARGQRVLGLERHTPAHTLGSSHGGSRIIRQAYHEDPGYVPLVQRAYELWRSLESESGESLLTLTGGLWIGPEESGVVQGALLSARQHGIAHELLNAAEMRRRFPVMHPREGDYGVYESEAGVVRPEAAVRAHLALAQKHGAMLHFEEPAEHWSVTHSGHVEVTTGRGTYTADRLVLAPGAWAPEILASLGLPIDIRRHVMLWFQPVDGVREFLPGAFPVYVWQMTPDNVFYGMPSLDGPAGGVKVAMHSGGDPCTPETLDRSVTQADIDQVRQDIAEAIPSLNGAFVKGAACMYTMTPDEHFIVAPHPQHPAVAIACGFSGHGFKFASAIGEVLADLTTDGRTRFDLGFLAPGRLLRADHQACER